MFESSFLLRLAPPALDGTIPLQPDYNDCWQVSASRMRALFNPAPTLPVAHIARHHAALQTIQKKFKRPE